MRALRAAYKALAEDAQRGEPASPAAEWLLDNFFIVSAAGRDIQHDLPSSFFWTTLWKGDRFHVQADGAGRIFVRFDALAMVGSEPLEAMDLVEIRARSLRRTTAALSRVNLGKTLPQC